ncbi:hypothetical protein KKP04_05775 [Rhodomicrobium sp. Az07]|uniref:hypothetical protein n=1 Tax=Rhodomicrobium sp. Az07 TaxID=2839034 RepID=UPI001BEAD646|nr:hypothetical protein [Rhodomicrobium sp. Az07]MBT3070373.1 hypothetical protein [Rhodomicrobium sp. Az07]
MSKAQSITKTSFSALKTAGRVSVYGTLMALPLCGLVSFFEMTRPAQISGGGFYAMQMAEGQSSAPAQVGARSWRSRPAVTRFREVSAESKSDETSLTPVLSSNDALKAFADAPSAHLRPGLYTEFVTHDHRRLALLIVSREPMTDQVIPDNAKLMAITQAGTGNVVSFAWGRWIYRVAIEDKGIEPAAPVVQKRI